MHLAAHSLALLVATTLPPQQGTVSLPPASAGLSAEFSDLTAMRELGDGRVLLYDRKEVRLVVAEFGTGSLRDIGRTGQGPGEFQSIAALLPLGGDSTLAADFVRRWLILAGDSIVATLPSDTPAIGAVSLWPLGADRQGRVLSQGFRRGGGSIDSTYVLLVERATGLSDTIARLGGGVRRAPISSVNDPGLGRGVRISRIPLNVREAPLLLPDGWTAVVRLAPYRVDWRSPDGRWTSGAPIPVRPIRMNESERKFYSDRNSWSRNATDWPELLPPFDTPTSLFATPDGWLVVKRLSSVGAPETRYDLIDKTGVRRSQLVLRPNEHVLGFGVASVYVVETDDDGIQRLRRHPYAFASLRP
ncbi:MAG TPA: hypothetical protein VIK50_00485 [Gemmatimonadaceae bacterium]